MSAFNQRNSDSMSLTEMLLKELDGNQEPSAADNKFREIEKLPPSANIELNIMDSELLDGVNIEKNNDSFGDLIEGYARENATNVTEMQRSQAVPRPVPPPQVMAPPMHMGPSNMSPYAPYPPMNYPQHIINTNSYGAPLPVPPPNFHYSNQHYNHVPDYKKLLTMSVSALPDTTLAIQLKNKKKKKTKKSGAPQEKSGEITNLWIDSPAPPSPAEPFAEGSPPSPTPDASASKSNSMKHVKEDKLVFKKQAIKVKSPIKTNRMQSEHSSEVNNIRKKQDNDIITSTRLDENESLSDLFTKLKTLNDELALLSEKPSAEDSDNEGKDMEDIPKPKLNSDVFISPKKTNLDTRIKMMISSSEPQNNISISSENTPVTMKSATSIGKRLTTLEQEKKMRTTLEQKLKITKERHQKLSLDKKSNSHIDWKIEEQKSIYAPTTQAPEVIPPPTPAALLKPPDMRRDVKTVLLNQKQAIRSDSRPWLDPIIPSDKATKKATEQEPALLRPLDKIPSPFLSKELYLYWHKESVKFIKYRERTMMKYINPQMRYIFKDNIVKELNSYARDDSNNITENKDEEDVEKYLERLNEINKKLQELDGCSPQEQNDSSDDNDESSDESNDNGSAKSIHNSSDDESSGSSDNESSKSNKSAESSDNDSSNSSNSDSDSSNDEADTSIDGTNKEKELEALNYSEQENKILKNDDSKKPTTEIDDVSNMDVVESSKVDQNSEMSDALTRKEEAMETDALKESPITKVRSMSVGEELEISDAKTNEGRGIKRSREESDQSKADSLIAQVMEYVVRELKGDIREHLERSFIDAHVDEFESSRKRMKLEV